jgi:hypothetical protein
VVGRRIAVIIGFFSSAGPWRRRSGGVAARRAYSRSDRDDESAPASGDQLRATYEAPVGFAIDLDSQKLRVSATTTRSTWRIDPERTAASVFAVSMRVLWTLPSCWALRPSEGPRHLPSQEIAGLATLFATLARSYAAFIMVSVQGSTGGSTTVARLNVHGCRRLSPTFATPVATLGKQRSAHRHIDRAPDGGGSMIDVQRWTPCAGAQSPRAHADYQPFYWI